MGISNNTREQIDRFAKINIQNSLQKEDRTYFEALSSKTTEAINKAKKENGESLSLILKNNLLDDTIFH